MKHCKKCGTKIPQKVIPSNGNKHFGKKRQHCFNCSPCKSENKSSTSSESIRGIDPTINCKELGWRKKERKRRKELLVKMMGGKCSKCGYDKSIRGLSFHHLDPNEKEFDISKNGALLKKWDLVLLEVKKCELLCLNCHAVLHNSD